MKGIGLKLLPFITLSIFILVMTTGSYFKKPFLDNDYVLSHIDQVTTYVTEGEWGKASDEIKEAKRAWNKVVTRIQFSTERNEINALKIKLERTEGYISAKELGGVLSELSEARLIWSELGK